MSNGMAEQGMEPTNDALAWAQANEDRSLVAYALTTKGCLLLEFENYSGALESMLKAYSIEATLEDAVDRQAATAGAIAQVYVARGDFQMAIPYYEESLANNRNNNDNNVLSCVVLPCLVVSCLV